MKISLIVAASENDVIGKGGEIPWKLPDDLRRFRELTKGKTIIMGRKTFESIGHPLPDRRNIVISRTLKVPPPGCELAQKWIDLLGKFKDSEEIWCIGGGEVYAQMIDAADTIELTRVHTIIEDGDTVFKMNLNEWEEIARIEHPTDAKHAFSFTYHTYRRKK